MNTIALKQCTGHMQCIGEELSGTKSELGKVHRG